MASQVRLRRIHGDTVRERPHRSPGLRGSLSPGLHRRSSTTRDLHRAGGDLRPRAARVRRARMSATTGTTSSGACPRRSSTTFGPRAPRTGTTSSPRSPTASTRPLRLLPAELRRRDACAEAGTLTRRRSSTRRSTSTRTSAWRAAIAGHLTWSRIATRRGDSIAARRAARPVGERVRARRPATSARAPALFRRPCAGTCADVCRRRRRRHHRQLPQPGPAALRR